MKKNILNFQKKWKLYLWRLLYLSLALSPLSIVGQTACIYDDGCPERLVKIGACDVQPGGYTGYDLTGEGEVIMQQEGGTGSCGIPPAYNYLFEDCSGNLRTEVGLASNCIDPTCSGIQSHSGKVAVRMIGSNGKDQRGVSPLAESDLYSAGSLNNTVNCGLNYKISCNTDHGSGGASGALPVYKGCSGFYGTRASDIDDLLHNDTPEHLFVKSSSNRSSSFGCFPPIVNSPYYELPNGSPSCKNTLIVGTTSFLTLNGPTSDGRIKPDVVARGNIDDDINTNIGLIADNGVYSSWSTPMVAGEAALIREQWSNFLPPASDEQTLYSSTLKNIIIHSSIPCEMDTELENWEQTYTGPDYECGWGFINVYKAVELVKQNHDNGGNTIHYDELQNGATKMYQITASDNAQDLKATIVWTDPGGKIPIENTDTTVVPNNPTLPALVNDLNIRILDSNAYDPINGTYDPNNGNIFKPFLLDPTNPAAVATKGVDNINNVEQVYIAPDDLVAGETYTIEVSHAGSLLDGEQAYSLIFAEGANDYLGCSNPMGVVEDTVQYCPDGSSVQLEAFGGENGGSYRWEPSSGSGLSNPNIANPTLDATVLNGEAATYVVTTIDANGCWHKTKVVVEPLICLEDCDIYIAHNPPSITDTDVILSIEDDLPDVEKYYWVIKGPLDLNSTNTFNPETCGHNYASSEFVDIRNTTTTPILEINYAESAANDEPIVPDGVYCVCVVVRYQSGECFTERLCQKMVLDPIGCFGDDPQDYDISYSQNGNLITVDPIASQYYIDNVITWALRDGNTLSLFDAAIPADENDPVVLQAPTSGLYNLELTIYASNPDCADQVVRTLLYVTTPCKTDEDIITNFTDGDQTEVVVSNGIQGYTDIESGADIIFNAGGSVCLFPGFKAEHGSVFCGKIEGCNQSNKETEVPSLESSNEISIYPNPTEDRFTLEYKLEQAGNVSFEIYNISGKLEKVLQPKRYLEAGFQSSNITIEDLSPGIYLIQGMIGSKQVIQKLVKM